jgi:hypothetical protein
VKAATFASPVKLPQFRHPGRATRLPLPVFPRERFMNQTNGRALYQGRFAQASDSALYILPT